uniref:F-box/FBD/LRR-repeat protein At2g04230-like n=2 Tax=Nicotiana TaxID=4085 RepID=A0A1S3ZY91_TOBAC|nr:PREDICTED: F-box/FBD/LRR-repeat protein At2g04230-like [Nicotiana sylvestris]XP_016469266.1 PREDICTED: F-box/FBD/LRR-repeat protein At2g04230-like [Nicotiana tabacum]
MDRITKLPEHIIYHIICRVGRYNLKEAARTCVLSKTWNCLWTLRPDLMFNQCSHNSFRSLEKFVKFVDDSLEPYVKENLSINSFILRQLRHPELAWHLDRWMNVAIKHNVRELEINSGALYYNVPDTIYAGVPLYKQQKKREVELLPCKIDIIDGYKTLEILSLEASIMTDQQFEHQCSKLSSLKELELRRYYCLTKNRDFGQSLC